MADSTAIAIVSVSVAGLATVAAPALAAHFENQREARRLKHERYVHEAEEVRRLLDEGAEWLEELSATIADMTGDVLAKSIGVARSSWQRFHEQRGKVRRHRARIAIRLGTERQVTRAFDLAVDRLDDLSRVISAEVMGAATSGLMTEAPFPEDSRTRILQGVAPIREQYEEAVEDFLAAARGIVGMSLSD